jgi:type II secretory pathway component PulM
MRELLERLRASFENLSPRERLLVGGAGVACAVFVVFLGVVLPVLARGEALSQRAENAEKSRDAVVRLRREYDDVKARLADVEARIAGGPRGNLRTTLEDLARQAGVRVESMEPQASPAHARFRETKVEVGLEAVSLEQAVKYLHAIESHRQVLSVKTLRLRTRADQTSLLDVTFTVSAFEPV